MIDLNQLIEQANDLPPLPASAVRLAEMVGDATSNLDDAVELIAFDQALTVRLLRAANSAVSGSATPIGSVKEAVIRMGTSRVLALCVASGAKPHLQTALPAYGLEEGALWQHAVAAAVSAEVVPGYCSVAAPPELFTAALLHDIGKLVMARFLSPQILNFLRCAHEIDHLTGMEAESLILQVHHGELGGLIAQHWKLPDRVVQGIIYHHNPDQCPDVIADLTHVSDRVAHRIAGRPDERNAAISLAPNVGERLGLTAEALEDLCPVAASRFLQVSARYDAI